MKQREIKFRAFAKTAESKNSTEMLNNYCFLGKNNHFFAEDLTNDRTDVGEIISVMQSIGIKDVNGIEIFEGDFLVEAKNQKNGGSEVFIKYGQIQPFSYLENYDGKFFQIIGNIYENPELLKFPTTIKEVESFEKWNDIENIELPENLKCPKL